MYTMGGLGIFAFPAYINPNKGFDISFFGTLIAVGVAMIIGFVITYITYKDKSDSTEEKIKESEKNEEVLKQEIFVSPVKGNVVPLDKVNDEVFSSGAAGKGVGIKPIDGKVYAPADGEVTMVFETGHAIALTTASNSELLIHIGIDTVELNGEGFKKHVKKGDKVKKGDLLISFDPKIIEEKGYDDTVILLVTNSDQFLDVIVIDKKVVDLNDELLAVAV